MCDGLTRVDLYVPEHDMVILIDGPCHYLEKNHYNERPQNFNEVKDLTEFMLPSTKMMDKILRHYHKRVLHFDY